MQIWAKMKEVAIAFALLVVILPAFLTGLNQETYHGDESLHVSRGIRSIGLILRGDFRPDAWQGPIRPSNVIMGVGPWLIGVRSGGWAAGVRPPDHVLVSARVMVGILGAITCLVLFYLGRALGGFRTGLFASLLLAFNPLWLMSSRQAMCDTPAAFFAIISIFLFYHGLKRKDFKAKASFITLSAMTTGLAIGSKYLAGVTLLTILIYLLLTIINDYDIDRTISLSRSGREALLGLFIFITLSSLAFIASGPYIWADTYGQLVGGVKFAEKFSAYRYNFAVPGDRLAAAAGIVHCVLWPIYKATPLKHFPTCLTWFTPGVWAGHGSWPNTYSTLPSTVFFFIGLAYLALRGVRKKLFRIEILVSLWFIVSFISLSWWTPILWARYFVQLIPPMVLIEAMGLSYLLQGMSQKMKYLFAGVALTTHVGSTLTGFPEYYLFYLQSLFVNNIGLTLTTAFIVSMFCTTIPRMRSILRHVTPLQTPNPVGGEENRKI